MTEGEAGMTEGVAGMTRGGQGMTVWMGGRDKGGGCEGGEWGYSCGAGFGKGAGVKAGKRRSWLLVPPFEDEVEEGLSHGPDVLVLDMVEFVSPSGRDAALEGLRGIVEKAVRAGGPEVFLQIDANRAPEELRAGVVPGVSGVALPRLEWVAQARMCDVVLGRLEVRRGIPAGSLQIVASLDTALGNHRAMELIQASSRVWGVSLGRVDLAMDLRAGPDGEFHLLPFLMQRLIIVAGAAGVTPLGAWWRPPARGLMASVGDTLEAAVRGKALGFRGAFCVSGEQVEALNRGFDGGKSA